MQKLILIIIALTAFVAVKSQLYSQYEGIMEKPMWVQLFSENSSDELEEPSDSGHDLNPNEDTCTEPYYQYIWNYGPAYFPCYRIKTAITPVTEEPTEQKSEKDEDTCTEPYYQYIWNYGPAYFPCDRIKTAITPVTEGNAQQNSEEDETDEHIKYQTTSSKPIKSKRSRRISEQKCEEYSRRSKENVGLAGDLGMNSKLIKMPRGHCMAGGLIVDEKKAKAGEFPHMVAIGYRNLTNNQIDFKCGGSLISERFVLTAAHCKDIASIVRIGDLNLKLKEPGLPEINVPILNFISHGNYNSLTLKNDIALIYLDFNVKFSRYVQPACLMTSNEIKHNKAVATGWGYTDSIRRKPSDHLLKVTLPIIKLDDCIEIYKNRNNFYLGHTQICAGALAGGKDTCNGDSGGPLQVASDIDDCLYTIIGVTSYGNSKCGAKNSPGVYTKVSAYIDWIEKIVWGENYS